MAEAVGDLPLAIEQAGSLLADTGMAVDKYLRLLGERAQDVLGNASAQPQVGAADPRVPLTVCVSRPTFRARGESADPGDQTASRPL